MVQCCKITGFPQCFLLFVRLCHGNLEPVHVGDSGLSCKAPHSGIYDVSSSCAKAFLWLLSDSSTQELHCRHEEITVGHEWRQKTLVNSLQDPHELIPTCSWICPLVLDSNGSTNSRSHSCFSLWNIENSIVPTEGRGCDRVPVPEWKSEATWKLNQRRRRKRRFL